MCNHTTSWILPLPSSSWWPIHQASYRPNVADTCPRNNRAISSRRGASRRTTYTWPKRDTNCSCSNKFFSHRRAAAIWIFSHLRAAFIRRYQKRWRHRGKTRGACCPTSSHSSSSTGAFKTIDRSFKSPLNTSRMILNSEEEECCDPAIPYINVNLHNVVQQCSSQCISIQVSCIKGCTSQYHRLFPLEPN